MNQLFLMLFLVSCASVNGPRNIETDSYWADRAARIMKEFDDRKFPRDQTPVVDELLQSGEAAGFRDNVCGGKVNKTCMSKFAEMIHARLGAKYSFASRADFDKSCAAYPQYCDNPRFMELAYVASHNGTVEEKREAWIREERAQADSMYQDGIRRPAEEINVRILKP